MKELKVIITVKEDLVVLAAVTDDEVIVITILNLRAWIGTGDVHGVAIVFLVKHVGVGLDHVITLVVQILFIVVDLILLKVCSRHHLARGVPLSQVSRLCDLRLLIGLRDGRLHGSKLLWKRLDRSDRGHV